MNSIIFTLNIFGKYISDVRQDAGRSVFYFSSFTYCSVNIVRLNKNVKITLYSLLLIWYGLMPYFARLSTMNLD